MSEKKTFYITTPIYYPSDNLHLGHCYTTVYCDAIARYKRLCGYDVFYLTGTDEHGQKIEEKAKAAGKDPKAFVDDIVAGIKDLWKLMDISYDKFIRTTDDNHKQAVQKIFQKLYDNGDIYKSTYEDWYCVPCESFWTKSQLKDGKCPDCGREVVLQKEESYFFRLSKYQDKVKQLLESNQYLFPESRVNEMVNNFINPGLNDLSVSRTSFDWGVDVPFDDKHVIYVWIDALSNYITALGYMSNDTTLYDKYWPADMHVMAKEIVRFHSIIWPAILMALDIPLPKKVIGHGWLLFDGDKMSKSKGNIINPYILVNRYGLDAVRYYLLGVMPFGSDASYNTELFLQKYNTDLVNSLGNLVSRTVAMVAQYCGGVIPAPNAFMGVDNELIAIKNQLSDKVSAHMEKAEINKALEEIMALVSRANKYIDETMPWVLNKSDSKERLDTVLFNLCESIRTVAVMLQPFITKTPSKIFTQLGVLEDDLKAWDKVNQAKTSLAGHKVEKGEVLFPRIDIQKELDELEKLTGK